METSSNRSQIIIFAIGILVYATIAYFGWIKLQYGFNFIDEGYHATESWRLAAGDHFLKDKITGALLHYTLINRLFFEVCPNITLLDFRKIQFLLTIFTLMLFGLSLFKSTGRYMELPFVFSLFAFTGLDPIGMISNLYYQTYPHLFITLHVSFLLFGLSTRSQILKQIFFILAGLCLWGLSLSHLTLSVIILSPVFVYWLCRKFNFGYHQFTFKNMLHVIIPFLFLWIIFILIFNKPYVINIFASIKVILSMPSHSTGLVQINWELIKYTVLSLFLLLSYFLILKIRRLAPMITAGAALSVLIFFIIKTSFFGIFTPYYNGLFGRPMWFSTLLLAFIFIFWTYILFKLCQKISFDREEELTVLLITPFTICAITMSIFSSLGTLAVCQTAIPAVAGIFFFVTARVKKLNHSPKVSLTMVLLLLGPFYYMVAENDWEFTFFDVQPKLANARIESGFGKGIYTNRIYLKLYDWLIANTEAFSNPDDYALSYTVSPMTHMIIKRRPCFDDTFIDFSKSEQYFKNCIGFMKKNSREPKIAFIFESMPALFPVSREKGTVQFFGKSFDFETSQDPMSIYVRSNMTRMSTFKISEDHIIRCYVNQPR